MRDSKSRIESQLQQAWSRVFPDRAVGLDDDFFALVGDGSAGVLAIRARSGMESQLRLDIPLSLLVRYPTIRELAGALAGRTNLEWPLVVKLSEGGSKEKVNFFLFPPLDGNSIWYRPLARELEGACTAWGLEIPGLDKRQRPIFSLPEIVRCLVRQVRTIQGKGPYFLGGYSFGGLLAFEAAIQLEAAGEDVGLLAMLDRSCPIAGKKLLGGVICPPELVPGHLPLSRKIDEHWNWTTRWVKTRARLLMGSRKWRERARVPDTRKIMKAAAVQMMAFYGARSKLRGKMLLLRQEGFGPRDRKLDETYGWKEHVELPIDIRFIPGPHGEVLDGRNARFLASLLRPCLDPKGVSKNGE